MARTTPQHKALYASFIDTAYGKVDQVNEAEAAKTFQSFLDARLAEIPDDGAPADGYKYNTHMGAFARALDEAKDHFVKGKTAFYAKRGAAASQ